MHVDGAAEPEIEIGGIWRWADWPEREELTGFDGRDSSSASLNQASMPAPTPARIRLSPPISASRERRFGQCVA